MIGVLSVLGLAGGAHAAAELAQRLAEVLLQCRVAMRDVTPHTSQNSSKKAFEE
ncbi:MAG: hypothetical protein ACREJ0_20320 [Geminicoccaceae bacterium]